METAHAVAADRFILVSALQAHNREHWVGLPYYVAKHYADKELMAGLTGLLCVWRLNRRARYRGGACRELRAWHYCRRCGTYSNPLS